MRRNNAAARGSKGTMRAFHAGLKAVQHWRNMAGPPGGGSKHPAEPSLLNGAWCGYWGNRRATVGSGRMRGRLRPAYVREMKAFLRGVAHKSKTGPPDLVLLPTRLTVGAVITAMNEAATLAKVLRQLKRLPLAETVVIVNGSRDESFAVAQAHGTVAVHYPEPLGHDVGRALGAKLTQADIVLFLDGDIPIRAERLVPFIEAVHRGTDVALNDITPFLGPVRHWDDVTLVKAFLNRALDRPDLAANAMTAVPHALSRKAICTIGPRDLSVPPVALVKALVSGLAVAAPAPVNVIAGNKRRAMNTGRENPVSGLIVGDHLEALQTLALERGNRIGFGDPIRNRQAAGGETA